MVQDEWIAVLRKENVAPLLHDGPVALMVSRKGKLVPATLTLAGNRVQVTTGRVFRWWMRIPLAQLKE